MPDLNGDYFANSVTFICQHNEDGAMGLVINKPSELTLPEMLSEVGIPKAGHLVETQVLQGGPVSPEHGFVLHSNDWKSEQGDRGSFRVSDLATVSTGLDVLNNIASGSGPDKYLVALGYAGWGAGQLEAEMTNNAWLNVPAESDILFELPYAKRLQASGDLLGIDFRLIARPGRA